MFKRQLLSILVLLAALSISYFNTFYNDFVFDDTAGIAENIQLKDPQYLSELYSKARNMFFLRPVVQTSLFVNYNLGALNVYGYHLLSVILHCFVILSLFFLARSLSVKLRMGTGLSFPLLTALLFGLHPIFTESVAYVSSRSSLFLTLFFVLSLLYFIRGIDSRRYAFWFLFIIFLVLGIGSKKNFFVFPFIVGLYLICFKYSALRGLALRNRRLISVFCLMSLSLAVYFIGPFVLAKKGALMDSLDMLFFRQIDYSWTPTQYFLTELNVVLFYYLKKIIFPFELSIDPLFPVYNSFFSLSILSLCVIITILFWGYRQRRYSLLIPFGVFWFFLTLAPTSTFVPILDFVAEHRLYLPGVGFVFIISGLIVRNEKYPHLLLLIFILLSVATIQRNFIWRHNGTLWHDASRKAPFKARPHFNLGVYYFQQGKYEQAADEYHKARTIRPNIIIPYNGLGIVYTRMGKLGLAEKYLKKALEILDTEAEPNYLIAKVYFQQGKIDLAEKYLTRTFPNKAHTPVITDKMVGAHYLLARIYAIKKRTGAALEQYKRAIKFNPDFLEAYIGIGILYAERGKWDLSEKYLLKSLDRSSKNPSAYFNLGYLYFLQKRYKDALVQYKEALRYGPESDNARVFAGDALFKMGDYMGALEYYGSVKEVGPWKKEALLKAGLCHLEMGGAEEADNYYSNIQPNGPNDSDLYLKIGKAFQEKGHMNLAVKYFKIAQRLDPERIKIELPDEQK